MLSLCTAPEGTVSGGGGCLLICRPEAGKLKLILLQTQFGQHLCLTQSQFVRNGGGSGGEETSFFTKSAIYWVPASSPTELYEQLSKYRFREIQRKQIECVGRTLWVWCEISLAVTRPFSLQCLQERG